MQAAGRVAADVGAPEGVDVHGALRPQREYEGIYIYISMHIYVIYGMHMYGMYMYIYILM